MTFAAPGYLALLVPAAVALAAIIGWILWRRASWRRFGIQPRPPAARWLLASMLIVTAIVLAAFAAARPQLGSDEAALDERGIDLVIVLDVSQSMLAEDVAPSRMEDAQQEINSLLRRMRGDRVGLVLFAGEPLMRLPLTYDLAAVQQVVLRTGDESTLVRPGSDAGSAIGVARDLLLEGEADTKVMLVVSDGEFFGHGSARGVLDAVSAGVRVYTAGAGTRAGAPVLDFDPQTSRYVQRIDENGGAVMTRLDAEALQAIAQAGNGRYVELAGDERALAELAHEFAGLPQTTFGDQTEDLPVERFQVIAVTAIALALLSAGVSGWGWRRPVARQARLWPLIGASVFIAAVCSSTVADYNNRGNAFYEQGDYAGALEQYRSAQAVDASRPEPYYNAGNALNRMGQYDQAVEETRRALTGEHRDDLGPLVEYATGNHYAGSRRYEDAREAYKRSLLADPSDLDAKHNLEVVDRLEKVPTATPPSELPPAAPPGGNGGEPQAGQTPGASPDTPGGDSSGDPDQDGDADLRSELAEALDGLDDEVTPEEARRILELVELENARAIARQTQRSAGGLPDY